MRRRQFASLAFALGLVLGCGGARPAPFSDKAKPLATSMRDALQQKNLEKIPPIVESAKRFQQRDGVTQEELAVLEACQKYAQEDKWEAASELIEKSLKL